MAEWFKRWNIKINEDMTQAIYFSHRIRLPESLLALNGWNIPFVNNLKYLSVIIDRKTTWRLHIKTIKAKAYRTFISTYSPFKSEQLSANIKLTLHKALVISIMTYASPTWEFATDTHLLKLQHLKTHFSAPHWFENCIRLSMFRTFTIIQQNYSGSKQKS
jgi:hypothetical protein